MIANKYDTCREIGNGSYGIVYKGKNITTDQTVAIKKFKNNNDEEGIHASDLREIVILKHLNHKNIVKVLDVCFHNKKMYMILEYAEENLNDYIKRIYTYPVHGIKSILEQILTGIAYCHSNNIVHRDLKPTNILIQNSIVKIADFGLARQLSPAIDKYTPEIMTLWYKPPEVLINTKYTSSVDIWSIGCIFAELLTGRILFKGDSEIDQLYRIFRLLGTPDTKVVAHNLYVQYNGVDLKTYFQLDDVCVDLLKGMLEYDPNKRLTAQQCLDHEYFKV